MVQVISQEKGFVIKTNLAGTPQTVNITLPFKPFWVRLQYVFLDSIDNKTYYIQTNLTQSTGLGLFNPRSGQFASIYQYIPDFVNGNYTFYPYVLDGNTPFIIPNRECGICLEFYNTLGAV